MKLNLGCGNNKLKDYLNVDQHASLKPECLHNLNKFPYPFSNNSAEEIRLDNVVEHLNADLVNVIIECKRILQPDGYLVIIAPNCFHWKSRLKFLFGRFGANQGYHYDHRWLLKPSFLKGLLDFYGFETNPINNLFDAEITIIARKRF